MNILRAKSTAMNCTVNINEELNYIELFKNILDLAGSQWSQECPSLCLEVLFRVIAARSIPLFFSIENEVRQKPTCYNLREMCFKKLFSLILCCYFYKQNDA